MSFLLISPHEMSTKIFVATATFYSGALNVETYSNLSLLIKMKLISNVPALRFLFQLRQRFIKAIYWQILHQKTCLVQGQTFSQGRIMFHSLASFFCFFFFFFRKYRYLVTTFYFCEALFCTVSRAVQCLQPSSLSLLPSVVQLLFLIIKTTLLCFLLSQAAPSNRYTVCIRV